MGLNLSRNRWGSDRVAPSQEQAHPGPKAEKVGAIAGALKVITRPLRHLP